jgi:hypothetical protein
MVDFADSIRTAEADVGRNGCAAAGVGRDGRTIGGGGLMRRVVLGPVDGGVRGQRPA